MRVERFALCCPRSSISRGVANQGNLLNFGCSDTGVGDRRPGIEELIGWRKHSSPNHYGQALTARDAKDAKEGQMQKRSECSNPVEVSALRLARYPNSASPTRYCLSLASLASLAVGGSLVRRSKFTGK